MQPNTETAAVNASQPRFRPFAYALMLEGRKAEADATVAAAVAAHHILATLYPGQKHLVRATVDATLLDAGIGPTVTNGKEIGVLEARR